MHAVTALSSALAAVAAELPTPSPTPAVDPQLVTPGPAGFAIMAFIALVVVLLIWDMQRRIRRARYREEVRAELDAEEQAARDIAAADADDQDIDPAGTAPR